MALLFAGLILWHFFRPVDELALLVFIVAGSVAIFRQRAWIIALSRAPMSKLHALPILAFAIWSANHALRNGGWDDYVYEFQAIRWFHDYAIVPGLANVHGRFGFNNAHHLYAACSASVRGRGQSTSWSSGLFIILLFALAWTACADLLTGRLSERAAFAAVFIAPCVARHLPGAELSQPMVSTLKADVASGALLAGAACLWVELFGPDDQREQAEPCWRSPSRCVLPRRSRSGSVRVLSLRSCSLQSSCGWRRGHGRVWCSPVGAVVTVLVAGMMIRGIVLSGYPLYPSTVMAADVDWRVPAAQADIERTLITTHAQWRSVYATTPTRELAARLGARDTRYESERHHAAGRARCLDWLRCVLFKRRRDIAAVAPHGWLGTWACHGRGTRGVVFLCAFGTIRVGVLLDRRGGGRGQHRFPRATWRQCDVATGGAGCCVAARGDEPPISAIGSDSVSAGGSCLAATWCAALIVALRRNVARVGIVVLAFRFFPVVDRVATDIFYRRMPQLARTFWVTLRAFPRRAELLTSARVRHDPV